MSDRVWFFKQQRNSVLKVLVFCLVNIITKYYHIYFITKYPRMQ